MFFEIISALFLIGIIKNFSSATSMGWLTNQQQRLESLKGNSAVNINLANLLTRFEPINDPRRFTGSETYAKKVRIRTDAISDNPIVSKAASKEKSKLNYIYGGIQGPIVNRSVLKWT